jgi:hypothetical protein
LHPTYVVISAATLVHCIPRWFPRGDCWWYSAAVQCACVKLAVAFRAGRAPVVPAATPCTLYPTVVSAWSTADGIPQPSSVRVRSSRWHSTRAGRWWFPQRPLYTVFHGGFRVGDRWGIPQPSSVLCVAHGGILRGWHCWYSAAVLVPNYLPRGHSVADRTVEGGFLAPHLRRARSYPCLVRGSASFLVPQTGGALAVMPADAP